MALGVVDDPVEARYSRNKYPVIARANLRFEKLRVLIRMCHAQGQLPRSRCEHAMRHMNDVESTLGGRLKQRQGRSNATVTSSSTTAACSLPRRGMRSRLEVSRFVFHLTSNLLEHQAELRSGAYQMWTSCAFTIHKPKLRRICAVAFRDRMARHALCAVPDPVVECEKIQATYACLRGKGTRAAVWRVREFCGRHR